MSMLISAVARFSLCVVAIVPQSESWFPAGKLDPVRAACLDKSSDIKKVVLKIFPGGKSLSVSNLSGAKCSRLKLKLAWL